MNTTYELWTCVDGWWREELGEFAHASDSKSAVQLINMGLSLAMTKGISDFSIVENYNDYRNTVFMFSEDKDMLPMQDLDEMHYL
ncbi:MAG: hypothetical protein IKE20_01820 [Eggerthellaceae bacterium]|nr:hypothetical protein [Eggerthellaceae bacterium]